MQTHFSRETHVYANEFVNIPSVIEQDGKEIFVPKSARDYFVETRITAACGIFNFSVNQVTRRVVLKAGMPESRNAGKPECRNAGMPECRNAGMPECWNAGMPEIKTRKS